MKGASADELLERAGGQTVSLRVSVVVPVRDEEQSIGRLLDSLLAQTRKPDEIIVVDGGSRDRTAEIVRTYIARGGPIRLISTDRAYPGQARNMGVSYAKGEVIVFWDGGMVPRDDNLERLAAPILAGSADVSHGRLVTRPESLADRCYMLALVPVWNTEQNGLRFNAHPVANSAIRKDLWEAVRGFRPWRAGEDLEFREKVTALSPRIAYDPGAVTFFYPAERFGRLINKLALYSRHNLLAAGGKSWHLGLGRIYGITLLGAAALAILNHVPLVVTFVSLFVGQFVLRVFRDAWRKKTYLPFSPWAVPTFLGVLLFLFCADLATWAGALMWLFGDKLRLGPETFRDPSVLCVSPEEKG